VALTDLIETRKTALTVLEVAEILSVSKRLVYQLVSIGEMPHFKVGGAVRFEPQALALWLRERMVESAKESRRTAIAAKMRGKMAEPFDIPLLLHELVVRKRAERRRV
jgi:excisionase family DNA binding protein